MKPELIKLLKQWKEYYEIQDDQRDKYFALVEQLSLHYGEYVNSQNILKGLKWKARRSYLELILDSRLRTSNRIVKSLPDHLYKFNIPGYDQEELSLHLNSEGYVSIHGKREIVSKYIAENSLDVDFSDLIKDMEQSMIFFNEHKEALETILKLSGYKQEK